MEDPARGEEERPARGDAFEWAFPSFPPLPSTPRARCGAPPNEPPPPPPRRRGTARSLARCPRTSGVSIARRASVRVRFLLRRRVPVPEQAQQPRGASRSSGPGRGRRRQALLLAVARSPSLALAPRRRGRAGATRGASRSSRGRRSRRARAGGTLVRRVQREGFLLRPGLSPRRRRRRERSSSARGARVGGAGPEASRSRIPGDVPAVFGDVSSVLREANGLALTGTPRRRRRRRRRRSPRDAGAPPFRTRRGGARGRSSWT